MMEKWDVRKNMKSFFIHRRKKTKHKKARRVSGDVSKVGDGYVIDLFCRVFSGINSLQSLQTPFLIMIVIN
jgi:hypothetical protein